MDIVKLKSIQINSNFNYRTVYIPILIGGFVLNVFVFGCKTKEYRLLYTRAIITGNFYSMMNVWFFLCRNSVNPPIGMISFVHLDRTWSKWKFSKFLSAKNVSYEIKQWITKNIFQYLEKKIPRYFFSDNLFGILNS